MQVQHKSRTLVLNSKLFGRVVYKLLYLGLSSGLHSPNFCPQHQLRPSLLYLLLEL